MKKKDLQKALYQAAGKCLTLLNRMIPKRADSVLFIGNDGLTDNNRALFSRMKELGYPESYRITCAIKNADRYRELGGTGIQFVSLKAGVWSYFRAKWVFYCNGTYPIKPGRGQMVVNLWHGTPLKRICKLAPNVSQYDYDYFTYVLAASDMFRPIMARCFGVSQDKVLVCGHARNDLLFRPTPEVFHKLSIERTGKLILWMPTFRTSYNDYIKDGCLKTGTGLPVFAFAEELQDFDEYLGKNGMQMIVKTHPMQKMADIHLPTLLNIRLLTNLSIEDAKLQLYELVAGADALITDYSSIYFDYLLLNRPIGFTCDDIAAYQDSRGFVVDEPDKLMPGEQLISPADFIRFAGRVAAGEDSFAEERERVNRLVNAYLDGKSCERLLSQIGLLKRREE